MNEMNTLTNQNLSGYTKFFPQKFYQTLVGFDDIFDAMNNIMSNNTSTYPPYNIVKLDDNHWVIEVAVAGFSQDDLEVVVERDQLIVRSNVKKEEENTASVYIHRGISGKNFVRRWRLAPRVEVEKVNLKNGILAVELVRKVPEEELPRKIPIIVNE